MQNLHPILDLLSVCNVYQNKRWDTHGFYFIFCFQCIEVIFHIYQMIYRYYSSFILLYDNKNPKNIVLLV